jgi:small-conductance mechanosensitive channel
MNFNLENIPYVEIVTFLLAGLLLLFVFNIVNGYVIPFIKEKENAIGKWWQRIQIISWLLFASLFYVTMLQANIIVTTIFTVLIFGIGWNYWRNVFAGILIKFSSQFRVGDIISSDYAVGELNAVMLSQTQLINSKGELVVIPNYKIREGVLKQLYQKHNLQTHSFVVKIAQDKTSEDLYQLALACPYISANQDIVIEKKQLDEYLLKVSIIDNSFIEKVNDYFLNL